MNGNWVKKEKQTHTVVQDCCKKYVYVHCLFFENLRIKKEVINVYSQDTIVVIIGLYNIFCDNDLFERIINFSERSDFLSALRFIRQRIC